MTDQQEPVPNEELEQENGELLPDREAMSVLQPPGAELTLGPDELPPIKPA
jgi:hypothetical protein